jgi:pimeloyl-ACP methyl ester carboxylesterase
MDDLTAVMDAVHIRKAHLFGDEDGAELCALFAASYPERVESLSVYALTPRLFRADGYPFGREEAAARAQLGERMALWDRGWGRRGGSGGLRVRGPVGRERRGGGQALGSLPPVVRESRIGGGDAADVAGHRHPGGGSRP